MDRIAQWRPIEPAGPEGQAEPKTDTSEPGGGLRLLVLGGLGAAVLAVAGIALWATTPQPQVTLQSLGQSGGVNIGALDTAPSASAEVVAAHDVVVDVEGAVERPGLHRLPAGSRVGDAIAAAGGYSAQVDIAAAAQRLNLAQRLADGDKIHVPARGEEAAPQPTTPTEGPPGLSGGGTATGLIDLNTADQGQLESLPGIGPVTAGKIIAAREQQPFATVDDLLAREVVGPATFEKIRDLVTVSP